MNFDVRNRVYKESGGKCYLCGRQAYESAPVGHPRRLTIDHVIAKANGGKDEKSNLKAACFECNLKKGTTDFTGRKFIGEIMSKKATIQNILKKEFEEAYKNWSYSIKLDNGDEGFLSTKKEFSGGEEIEYTIDELMSKAGKPYKKIRLVGAAGAPFGGKVFSRAAESEKFPGFALSYAKDSVNKMLEAGFIEKNITSSDVATVVCSMADKYLKWLNENKG